MGIDLKKEIKLSDLLPKRKKSADGEPVEKAEKTAKAEKPKRSFLPARKPKEPKAPKAASPDAKAGPALATTPLMRAFDLLPKDEARERRGGRVPLPQVGVALLALVVIAGLTAAYTLMGAGVTEKRNRVDDLRAQIAAQPKPTQPDPGTAEQPALDGESQARTAALASALSTRVAWDRVLREFSLVLPADVWLTSLAAGVPADDAAATAGSSPASSVTINGFAKSQEAVALLLSRLELIPEFSSVQLQSSTRSGEGSELAYLFALVATIGPEGVAS